MSSRPRGTRKKRRGRERKRNKKGKTIDSYTLDTNMKIQINLGTYANGIYQVKVSNEGATIMKQFVKK